MSTLTRLPEAPAPAPSAAPAHSPHLSGNGYIWVIPVVAGAAGFAWLLRTVYADAWAGSEPDYALFWAGMACLFVPVVLALTGPRTPGQVRALVALYALLSFLPKVLRAPERSWLFDEYAHLSQADGVLRTGELYEENFAVPMLQPFPGLHLDIAAVVRSTGLDTYHAGLVVVAAAHVAIAAAVFTIAHRLSARPRLAGLAAVVYMTTPGWMLFGSQVSYESVALAFYAWALAGAVLALTSAVSFERNTWATIAALSLLGAAFTHHLTTAFTVAGLGVLLLAHRQATKGISRRAVLVLLGLFAAGCMTGQFVEIPLLSYLGSVPVEGIEQLVAFLTGTGSAHAVFTGSALPPAEQWLALLAPPVLMLGMWFGWRSGRLRPAGADSSHRGASAGIAGIAAGYIVAAPLVFTQVGSEAAHRSWAFTLLAASVLIASALDALADRLSQSRSGEGASGSARLALVGVLSVLLVGSTAAGGTAEARFPGEYRTGADVRIIGTDELWGLSTWLRDTQGPGHLVLSDVVTAGALAGVGQQNLDLSFPTWDLTFFEGITPKALRQLSASGAEFLVVDTRMSTQLPRTGYYYKSYESQAFVREEPLPAEHLDKLEGAAWLHTVYASENYRVYSIDHPELERKLSALEGYVVDTKFVAP